MATNKKQIPQGLSDWQDQLQKAVLPANPRVKAAALQKLNANTGNAKNVAAILLEDPGLCLLLMREANQVLQHSDNETNSLTHTISLLGFPYVEALLRRTKDYDKKHFTNFSAYRQQLSTSLHAAYQMEAWAEQNPFWPSGELFWATLFQRAPSWALWYRAGEQMQQLEQLRALHHGSSHSDIEFKVFGCRLHELYRLVSRSWNLPRATQESWQLGVRGTARQWVKLGQIGSEQSEFATENSSSLLRVCSSPAFAIALANQLAEASEWNWYSRQTFRLQKILSTAMQITTDQATAFSHQQAIRATRQYHISRSFTPAQQLFSAYNKARYITDRLQNAALGDDVLGSSELSDVTASDEYRREETLRNIEPQKASRVRTPSVDQTQPAAHTSSPSFRPQTRNALPKNTGNIQGQLTEKPNSTSSQTLPHSTAKTPAGLVSALQRLKLHPNSFKNKHEILDLALQTMREAIGLDRATISLLNRKTKNLRSLYDFGCENSPVLTQFNHTLVKGDFFNKLLQKTVSIHLNSNNYSKIWPALPENFRAAIATDEFVMMSIFVETIPTAVVYADRATTKQAIKPLQYRYFKQLCAAVSLCLETYSDS